MNKIFSIEELNKEIALTKHIIASTNNWKCKRDHQKSLRKLLAMRKLGKDYEWEITKWKRLQESSSIQ